MQFSNTTQYSPILYAPQTVGMIISRAFNLSLPTTFYIVRITGFLAWLSITAYGIKQMKRIGWAAVVLLCTPLTIQIVSGITADSMTIAASVLVIGLFVKAVTISTVEKLGKKDIIILLLAVVLISFSKIPYALIASLFLLIPAEIFKERKYKRYFVIAMLGLGMLTFGGWSAIAQRHYVSYRTITTGVVLDEHKQVDYLITHPLSFTHKLYSTYLRSNPYSLDPLWGYIGALWTTGTPIPFGITCCYCMLIGAVFMALRGRASNSNFLKMNLRLYAMCLLIGLFILINMAVFITWSRPQVPIIEGIQSRYFIPIIPLLILTTLPVLNKNIKLSKPFCVGVLVVLMITQLATLMTTYYNYYAPIMTVVS